MKKISVGNKSIVSDAKESVIFLDNQLRSSFAPVSRLPLCHVYNNVVNPFPLSSLVQYFFLFFFFLQSYFEFLQLSYSYSCSATVVTERTRPFSSPRVGPDNGLASPLDRCVKHWLSSVTHLYCWTSFLMLPLGLMKGKAVFRSRFVAIPAESEVE